VNKRKKAVRPKQICAGFLNYINYLKLKGMGQV
jgi:hypothetical protein